MMHSKKVKFGEYVLNNINKLHLKNAKKGLFTRPS